MLSRGTQIPSAGCCVAVDHSCISSIQYCFRCSHISIPRYVCAPMWVRSFHGYSNIDMPQHGSILLVVPGVVTTLYHFPVGRSNPFFPTCHTWHTLPRDPTQCIHRSTPIVCAAFPFQVLSHLADVQVPSASPRCAVHDIATLPHFPPAQRSPILFSVIKSCAQIQRLTCTLVLLPFLTYPSVATSPCTLIASRSPTPPHLKLLSTNKPPRISTERSTACLPSIRPQGVRVSACHTIQIKANPA